MNKTIKILAIFLVFDVVIVGFYFGVKAISPSSRKSITDAYEW